MKKSSILFTAFLLLSFSNANLFGQTPTTNKLRPSKPPIVAPVKTTTAKIDDDVAEALTIIQDHHVKGNKLDYNLVFKSSMDSMLHTLDPHSNYFDAKETEEFMTDQSSRYYGIGAIIGDLSDAKGNVIATFIKATFENAPANRAGLRYGDKIVDINGISMLGKDRAAVSALLRGPRGTQAKIVVERYGTGKPETVTIIRDAVSQPSIPEAYMIRPGIGYIAMTGGFNQTTYQEFAEAMSNLKAQGMKQLIMDLRNNGGGLVSQSLKVAETFLPEGETIFTQKGRLEGTEDSYTSQNPSPDNTPIVILVNQNTASASEIFSGAMQDHDRALIVGENTFGKGLVQNPFRLDYGSMLLLTIAKYRTPSGRLIQRDYSNGNLYDYYTKGGTLSDEKAAQPPTGEKTLTDTGRPVFGGGGIMPDVIIKPQTITNETARLEQKLTNPIFAYVLNLSFGKVAGYDTYKVDRPISFEYDIKANDFPISEAVFQDFKKFAAAKYNFTPQQIDRERAFIERYMRSEFVTAAYGSTTSNQVFNEYDNQLLKAIELLPQAKQLELEGMKVNNLKPKQGNN